MPKKFFVGENKISIFDRDAPLEKGSREWGTFNAVRRDVVPQYPVSQPKSHTVVKERGNSIKRAFAPSPTLRSAH